MSSQRSLLFVRQQGSGFIELSLLRFRLCFQPRVVLRELNLPRLLSRLLSGEDACSFRFGFSACRSLSPSRLDDRPFRGLAFGCNGVVDF